MHKQFGLHISSNTQTLFENVQNVATNLVDGLEYLDYPETEND